MTARSCSSVSWVLRPRRADRCEPSPALAKQPLLLAVARRGAPGLIEASLTPAVIFLATRSFAGARWAMLAVLVWGCANVVWRRCRGRRLPALVVFALVGLLVRTLVGVASGSTFAYFAQPVATLVAIAGVLLVSAVVGRPLVARVAHDFCPIAPEVATRPSVVQLFLGLTVLWAGAQLVTAAATLGMLLSLDLGLFVVLKPVVSLTVSAAAIAVTVWWALRVAHREDLEFALA